MDFAPTLIVEDKIKFIRISSQIITINYVMIRSVFLVWLVGFYFVGQILPVACELF